jgi:guanylate kinase
MKTAPLIVLSGPSGVGKTTVVERALACGTVPARRATTATSRAKRENEQPNDYHFWSRERFEAAIAANEMLEYAIVHGHDYYGTPKSEVDHDERATILIIDVQGAAQVRAIRPCLSVFVLPPSWDELKARLMSRGTEDPTMVARRFQTAEAELARRNEFDVRIVNRDLDQTVLALKALIQEQLTLRGA